VNLLGDSVDTIKKNTQTLINANKEVDLEVNTEKTKYMFLSRLQNAGQNQEIKIGNRCFKNVAQFRYLGTTVTNQNPIQEEIKEKAELHNLLSSAVLKT
jgi:ribosomal protein S2